MRLSLRLAIPIIVMLFVLFAVGVTAFAQGSNVPPSDKGPLDRVVFVHYPRSFDPNSKGGPSNSGSGALVRDYKVSGYYWADPNGVDNQGIPYRVNPSNPSRIPENAAVSAVDAAFQTWQDADSNGGLRYHDVGTASSVGAIQDSINTISWQDISQSYPNAIAVTYVWSYRFSKQIVEFDMVLNSALPWAYTAPEVPATPSYADPTNSGAVGKYDVQNIATHEAGHTLMLNDLYKSRDQYLTMYGYGSTGELRKDTLGYGDSIGVNAIYP